MGRDEDAIKILRDHIRSRGIKLTRLSRDTGIPYKSLHNYFSSKTAMPLGIFVTICEAVEMPIWLPLYGSAPLDQSILTNILEDMLSNIIPFISIGENLEIMHSIHGALPQNSRHKAGIIAALLMAKYTLAAEVEIYRAALDDEGDQ